MNPIILEWEEVLIRDFPLSPSSNHLYRTIKNRHKGQVARAKTSEYNTYCKEVEIWALAHGKDLPRARTMVKDLLLIHKTLQVDITFCIEDSRCFTKKGEVKKHDTFNHIKALHDQLSECLWTDDRYFWDGMIRRKSCPKGEERAIIRIKGRSS